MKVIYKNNAARKQFSSEYKDKWKYPTNVAIELEAVENFIQEASSLADIANFKPFHFERLEGKLKNEWSIRVGNTKYRVTLIPCDENKQIITEGDILARCKYIKIILVTGVSNHYG